MKCECGKILKKAVVVYFKISSRYSAGQSVRKTIKLFNAVSNPVTPNTILEDLRLNKTAQHDCQNVSDNLFRLANVKLSPEKII
jgi:hypothetical protein